MVCAIVAAAVAAVAAVMVLGAIVARRRNSYAVVDVAWGLAFAAASIAMTLVALLDDVGTAWRTLVLTLLVLVWALRLAIHLGERVFAAEHDDPRYLDYLGAPANEVSVVTLFRKVFGLQGLIVLVIAVPLIVGIATEVRWAAVVWVGVVVTVFGIIFEAVADRQLAAFKADSHTGPILDTGVWSWSRHPNYFGDACLWWGLWLVGGAASGWIVGLSTLIAPVLMTILLTAGSGVRIAERRMQGRDGWDEYAARTSIFFPLPPKS